MLCRGVRGNGRRAQQLNVICPVQAEWCALAATEFEKETGIKVSMTLEGFRRIVRADRGGKSQSRSSTSGSAGPAIRTLQAAEQGLARGIQVADARAAAAVGAEAGRAIEVPHGRACTSACSAWATTPSCSTKKKLAAPACWKDLIKPEFAGEVQMANPNASGTAYTAIATLVQVMGEEEAFKYLKALHKNINNYPRSGVGPIKAAARGETLASVSFIHDVITEAQAGFPVKAVAPCEGTGYEIGSLSIVKGARNLDNAKNSTTGR